MHRCTEIRQPAGEKKHRTMHLVEFAQAKAISVAKDVKQLGKDDPRRVYHAMKVGVAITLVSLFYYFRPLYDGFGSSTIWAVMTVVVVFEFTVGGALYKCINRGCATFLGGALGVGVQHLTTLCGDTGRPIVLALFIFGFAAWATFLRFFPYLKARFDYGFTIFILTFTMVSVTGYRADEILSYAQTRLVTIVLGVALVMMISIFVYPVWAGEDLHSLIANNIAKLANYLEGFEGEYFQVPAEGCAEAHKADKPFLLAYKSVLNSKSSEESLATFARWEPFHGRFRLKHPWKLYLDVGVQARQVAYLIDALNGHLTQANVPLEFQSLIQEPCKKICSESSKALKALSCSIKDTTIDPLKKKKKERKMRLCFCS
uniref:Aluminum-activated malate transporter n=1 Tax=Kalanchoe fedtschenkoi TaxID=63787 RepID=A0A7N0VH89_KALFE